MEMLEWNKQTTKPVWFHWNGIKQKVWLVGPDWERFIVFSFTLNKMAKKWTSDGEKVSVFFKYASVAIVEKTLFDLPVICMAAHIKEKVTCNHSLLNSISRILEKVVSVWEISHLKHDHWGHKNRFRFLRGKYIHISNTIFSNF